MLDNIHNVERVVWRKWPQTSRKIFNTVYGKMIESPEIYAHPEAVEVPEEYWKITCWNSAWEAAHTYKELLETSTVPRAYVDRESYVNNGEVAELSDDAGDRP